MWSLHCVHPQLRAVISVQNYTEHPHFCTRQFLRLGRLGRNKHVLASLKGISSLKQGLARRFSNIYEAYIYCDFSGNWVLTENMLKLMLPKLGIDVPDIHQV